MATTGAVLAGSGSPIWPAIRHISTLSGFFLFGAFSLPLYSLAAAHANDHAKDGQFVQVAAGLLFFFSLGATVGPVSAAAFVELGGPKLLFNYISMIHALLIFATIWRMPGARRRAGRRARPVCRLAAYVNRLQQACAQTAPRPRPIRTISAKISPAVVRSGPKPHQTASIEVFGLY